MARNAIDGAMGINSNSFYDCKSGLSISVILALTLAWIPYFGPIVAGFVGGRRAGSIMRGLLIGAGSCLIVFIIAFLLNLGLTRLFEPEYQSFMDGVGTFAPQVIVALESLSAYLSSNFVDVGSDLSVSVPSQAYASIVAFAIIGGVFADQYRKELRIIVSHTEEFNKPKPRRSVSAFLAGQEMGFHTYDDLTRMNVNADCASMHTDASADTKAHSPATAAEPPKVQLAVPEVVTTSIVSEVVTASPTNNVPVQETPRVAPADVPADRKTGTKPPSPVPDDLEWF